ncbi:MAG: hypothetical protein WDN28_02130 [Chthoniobacter sp.]
MSTVKQIEAAIAKLRPEEFRALLHRLNEREAVAWDQQIEDDAQSGKLDRFYSRLMEEDGGEPKVPLDEVVDDPKLS